MPDFNAGIIALLNVEKTTFDILSACDFGTSKILPFNSAAELIKDREKLNLNITAIISEGEVMDLPGLVLYETVRTKMHHVPFFLLAGKLNPNLVGMCLQSGIADVFTRPLVAASIEKRINFVINNWDKLHRKNDKKNVTVYKTPIVKRAFDIFFSSCALLCLSPVLLIVIAIMKLESRGPVFYYSLRVGTGYKVFKFYKFRSMYVNADKRLKELQHLNQYNSADKPAGAKEKMALCDECIKEGERCRSLIYADGNTWCEKLYLTSKKQQGGSAFFKLKDDPRITKVGAFIRNTSIDELPQLWNVLKGNMSIVGNRPLPLYEAEKLTTDKYALRFLAPAGLTGLWQVEKRGKGKMSEEERLMLDNTYAENHSFWYDIKLILKTIPALLQKENV